VVVATALAVALSLPTAVLGGKPAATSKQDTAIAYFLNPDESACAILTLWQGMYRPIGSDQWSYGQGFDVQLGDGGCNTAAAEGAGLDPSQYRIIPLSAAFVVSSIEVAGQTVDLDVSWVAVGTPTYAAETHDNWSFTGKEVAAHLTGTIEVDGVPWDAQQDNAILRDFSIAKNF
jgi:hypothetical protein